MVKKKTSAKVFQPFYLHNTSMLCSLSKTNSLNHALIIAGCVGRLGLLCRSDGPSFRVKKI
ncbi:hypothetical protein BpHYR1_032957 [Brachionus plicatilis]|uniref:Uncharacterized protein n=1 Tax=Brachionus plicatilis TaxID=10195 RepID=A0A3M7QT81_BRAPC|nr:hypothetical protein BpHYR1_032957 [Brachionus plicatilis]